MNTSVRSMIEMSAACLLFLTAITIGLFLFQRGAAALDTAFVSGRQLDRSIASTLSPIAGDGMVSGAEVLQTLAQIDQVGAEVVVDGRTYPPTLERDQLTATELVLAGRYRAETERDGSGAIIRIRFALQGGAR
ncbi:hypothetical protein [Cohnella fermenti]|uniref:Uncharacterized protein n=1 Tax=Cohnella fermenti TaxID=2565925 RepID=A0A4S4BPA7_9BACL|nr:hypothetical protein [Cohnella fermenti]THF74387.1 hypothetical protein E6C55_25425 [Cohnella fermenti]